MKRAASHAGSWYEDNSKYAYESSVDDLSLLKSLYVETKLNEELTHYLNKAKQEDLEFPIQGTRAIIGP